MSSIEARFNSTSAFERESRRRILRALPPIHGFERKLAIVVLLARLDDLVEQIEPCCPVGPDDHHRRQLFAWLERRALGLEAGLLLPGFVRDVDLDISHNTVDFQLSLGVDIENEQIFLALCVEGTGRAEYRKGQRLVEGRVLEV